MNLTIAFSEPDLAMVKMPVGADVAVRADEFFYLAHTGDETTVICKPESAPHAAIEVNAGWSGFKVQGPFAFGVVGVIANLSKTMAEAGISVIPLSSFDTDWILVRSERAQDAARAWQSSGHRIEGMAP